MYALSASANSKPAFSAGRLLSVVVDGESSPKDVVEGLVDEDVAGKQVAVSPLYSQTYRRKEALPVITKLSMSRVRFAALAEARGRLAGVSTSAQVLVRC